MLTNVFENRNRYFTNLVKLADFLGRSLRENVEVFSVDGNEVTFITENNKVIKGTFNSNKPYVLENIKVEDTSIFEEKSKFSQLVDKRVSTFLSNIIESDLINAEDNFDDILKLWELRLQFTNTKNKLVERSKRFKDSKITNSQEFKRVLEVKDTLISFLKKNSKVISGISEIRSAVKLATAISECFNLPKVNYENLNEGSYRIPGRVTQNLYEHLTKIELINKELNESKDSFNTIWSNNDLVANLAAMIYEQDSSKIYESLAQVIHQVPYFALTTKKQLVETFRTVLNLLEQDYSDTQLKKFVSLVYESKKPVKNYLINLLNEKYGINVSNLTETPTFASLANTEALIFEALSVLSPKGSNLRRVLSEMASVLKKKNGVETIDVADFLNEIFAKAQYSKFINETNLLNYLDFNKVADDLGKIGSVLKMIQGNMSGGQGASADLMGADIGGLTQGMGQEDDQMSDDQYGAEIDAQPEEEMPEEGMEGELPQEEMGEEMPNEGMGDDMPQEEMPPEEGMESEASPEDLGSDDEMPPSDEMPEDQLLNNLKELEDMIATLKNDLGVEDMQGDDQAEAFGGEETPEEEAMEDHEMGEENEENEEGDGDVNIDVDTSDDDADSDSDDDEVHIDIDSHKDEEEEEEGEEEEDEDEEKQEESSHKGLKGKQHRLDKNKNGKLDKMDFKMLRKGKK